MRYIESVRGAIDDRKRDPKPATASGTFQARSTSHPRVRPSFGTSWTNSSTVRASLRLASETRRRPGEVARPRRVFRIPGDQFRPGATEHSKRAGSVSDGTHYDRIPEFVRSIAPPDRRETCAGRSFRHSDMSVAHASGSFEAHCATRIIRDLIGSELKLIQ